MHVRQLVTPHTEQGGLRQTSSWGLQFRCKREEIFFFLERVDFASEDIKTEKGFSNIVRIPSSPCTNLITILYLGQVLSSLLISIQLGYGKL